MILVHFFTPPDFHAKDFTPQKSIICEIVHSRPNSGNALNQSFGHFFGASANEPDSKILTFWREKNTNK